MLGLRRTEVSDIGDFYYFYSFSFSNN